MNISKNHLLLNIVAVLFVCIGFVSCSQDESSDELPYGKFPMDFEATDVAAPIIRTTDDYDWSNVDTMAVQIGGQGEVKAYNLSFAAEDNTARLTSSDPFYWQTTEAIHIASWYPYTSTPPTQWAVKADQSQALAHSGSDFIYAFNPVEFNGNKELAFYHQTAKLVVLIKMEGKAINDQADINDIKIGDNNLALSGAYTRPADESAHCGSWQPDEASNGSITPFAIQSVPSGYTAAYEALVIPQNMGGKKLITIKTSDGTFYYTPPIDEADFMPCHIYTYYITIERNGLNVAVGEIMPWETGSSGNGVITLPPVLPVKEVETAVPAFIGFTEKAVSGNNSLLNRPWKITSMSEFVTYFGGAPLADFKLSVGEDGKLAVTEPTVPFTLYNQMLMFFANGGGTCYIVSVGDYTAKTPISNNQVKTALAALEKKREVTLIVVPEVVYSPHYANIQTDVLQHCFGMMNRMAILDVQPKKSESETIDEQIKSFHYAVGGHNLSFGAAYYPWLNTSILSDNDVNPASVTLWDYDGETPDLTAYFGEGSELLTFFNTTFDGIRIKKAAVDANPGDIGLAQQLADSKAALHNTLLRDWQEYKSAIQRIKNRLNLLPPSAGMAGIYTAVDKNRGVWKAPTNVSVSHVISPAEDIDDYIQEKLSQPMNGKAVNVIRSFPGGDIKVWGARTLDSNSLDWRYVNARRTMLYLEESVKNIAGSYIFAPNDASTWTDIKSTTESFLRKVWKRGGLAGGTTEEAFEVHVGLGQTMIAEDIQKGILRVTVLVAIARPSEFIEITFEQQMQRR